MSGDNIDIWLLKKEAGTKALTNGTAVRTYDRHWTPLHLDFEVENLGEVQALVLKHGGTHEGGESGEWGSIAYCADPFGNGFCLIQIASRSV